MLATAGETEIAIISALRLLTQLLHRPGNSPVPWVIFFYGHCRVLFILLHFCLLFLLLAHKQCGQFCFTCPGVPDPSPASMALSGCTVKCWANKMHKAEIGKSMPLLITLRHLSRGLPGRAGASGTTQARPGALPLAPCPLPSWSRTRPRALAGAQQSTDSLPLPRRRQGVGREGSFQVPEQVRVPL